MLDTYELGNFNIACAAKYLIDLKSEEDLLLGERIISATLVASPDLVKQKAYAGNGGSPALYWICDYLSAGIGVGSFYIKNEFQYKIFFRLFVRISASSSSAMAAENYWMVFQQRLIPGEGEVKIIQKEILLRLIQFGYSYPDPLRYYSECFSCLSEIIKTESFDWVPLFFPFADMRIQKYLDYLQECLNSTDSGKILNGFKTSKSGRKFFREYFLKEQHWLLSYIIYNSSSSIGKLVEGNELEILEPFFKNYKKEMISICDKNGNSLLHSAVLAGNPSEKMITRLISIHIPRDLKNNNGETAFDIALCKRREDLSQLLTR